MASGNPEATCSTCIMLRECQDVNAERLFNHGWCNLWAPAKDSELYAREEIVKDMGPWALRYMVPHLIKDSAKHSLRRRKTHG